MHGPCPSNVFVMVSSLFLSSINRASQGLHVKKKNKKKLQAVLAAHRGCDQGAEYPNCSGYIQLVVRVGQYETCNKVYQIFC